MKYRVENVAPEDKEWALWEVQVEQDGKWVNAFAEPSKELCDRVAAFLNREEEESYEIENAAIKRFNHPPSNDTYYLLLSSWTAHSDNFCFIINQPRALGLDRYTYDSAGFSVDRFRVQLKAPFTPLGECEIVSIEPIEKVRS